jgi:multisubunit Na+/H+ antiporter MnhE subunit
MAEPSAPGPAGDAQSNSGGPREQGPTPAYRPLAGEPRERPGVALPRWQRFAAWLAWWVILMSLWVAVDDSFAVDELIAGALAAAVAALVAEVAGRQAGARLHVRPRWLLRALRLPGQVAVDTFRVFALLARVLLRRQPPPHGAFREVPVRYGDDTPPGVTRRVLLTAGRSLSPNAFVVGFDAERDTMLVHELVRGQ